MCRNIKTLFNFDPPATDEEIRAASLQFVRKLSGFTAPSRANEAAFNQAIEEVFVVARRLLDSLETAAPPKNRDEEAAKARAPTRKNTRPALVSGRPPNESPAWAARTPTRSAGTSDTRRATRSGTSIP